MFVSVCISLMCRRERAQASAYIYSHREREKKRAKFRLRLYDPNNNERSIFLMRTKLKQTIITKIHMNSREKDVILLNIQKRTRILCTRYYQPSTVHVYTNNILIRCVSVGFWIMPIRWLPLPLSLMTLWHCFFLFDGTHNDLRVNGSTFLGRYP